MEPREFEVRNRHGDVVQRGETEIVSVEHGVEIPHAGLGAIVTVEFHEPIHARNGDVISGVIDLREVLGDGD